MNVPCGRCMSCRLNRTRMWALRIMHEAKKYENPCFITLTYNDENLPVNGTLVKRDLQDFFRRLRKEGYEIRYFASGEYGDCGNRPHYHCVVFGMGGNDKPAIEKCWPKGFVTVSHVTYKRAAYVASYTQKKLTGAYAEEYKRRKVIPEFALMSRRPGLGADYVEQYSDFIRRNKFCVVDGKRVAVPRFYKDRVFKDDKSELLKLSQQIKQQKVAELMERDQSIKSVYDANDYMKSMRQQSRRDLETWQKMQRRKL